MFQDLPAELLERVCGHMSSRDWARARAACKSFSQVQPQHIGVIPPNIAAARWCTKLWQQADWVALNLGLLGHSSSELSQVLDRGARDTMPSRLTELRIEGLYIAGNEDVPGWLSSIFERANNLQTLIIGAGSINSLPAMSQLRHLVLHVEAGISAQACASIEGLKNLETISIKSPGNFLPISIPALDLRGCRNLKAAYFASAVPEKLLGVPNGCRLMIECALDMAMPQWENFSQMCTGVRIHDVALPRAIFSLPCPLLTQLELTSIGYGYTTSIVISGAMPNLRVLKVHCYDVALRIEASVQLRHLSIHVHCLDELFIRDVSKLIAQLSSLRLSIDTITEPESQVTVARDSVLSELKAAMAAKSAEIREIENVGWLNVEYVCGELGKNDLYPRCQCLIDGGGACQRCLKAAGIIQSKY